MIIARVVGNVIATQKQSSHEGKKILLIQPLDLEVSLLAMWSWPLMPSTRVLVTGCLPFRKDSLR